MAKHRSCVRTDGLDKEQTKELRARIDKVVTDFRNEITEKESEPTQTSEEKE